MEIRSEPVNLQIKDDDILCSCCNTILQQNIKKGKYLISECYDCRYLERPFGSCRSISVYSSKFESKTKCCSGVNSDCKHPVLQSFLLKFFRRH